MEEDIWQRYVFRGMGGYSSSMYAGVCARQVEGGCKGMRERDLGRDSAQVGSAHIYMSIYVCISMCVYLYGDTFINACTYTGLYIQVYMCIHTCMYMYVSIMFPCISNIVSIMFPCISNIYGSL